MIFGFCHHQLRGLVDRVIGTVPVDDYAINATAYHIVYLGLDLRGICGAVTHVHMVRASEPEHHVSVNFRRRARVKQRVDIDLAYVAGLAVTVGLN
jgi:hypothetical protein